MLGTPQGVADGMEVIKEPPAAPAQGGLVVVLS
jgi:hypothetical protein